MLNVEFTRSRSFNIQHSTFNIEHSSFPRPTPPPQHPPRECVRHPLFLQHWNPIDNHIDDAFAEVMRILVSCHVTNAGGIEYDDIRLHARPKEAAVGELRAVGCLRGHLAHRFLQSEELLIANVMTEDTWKRSVGAGVGGGATRAGGGSGGARIGTD